MTDQGLIVERGSSALAMRPDHPPPSTRTERRAVAGIALLAALPSLWWATQGAGYLSDDWWIAYWYSDLGISEALGRVAFDQPARPLAAPYYLTIYEAIGQRPLLQCLLLAAINALAVLAVWRLGRRHLPVPVVIATCTVYALLPNHSSTRLWFVVGNYPLALALAAAGLVVLERRFVLGIVAVVAALFLYEGVAGFAGGVLLALLVRWWRDDRRNRMLVALGAVAFASVVRLWMSPGSQSGITPMRNASTFGPGLLGQGLIEAPVIESLLPLLLFSSLGLAAVTMIPSFRIDRPVLRQVRLGWFLAFAGAGPILVGGVTFAVAGLNDRNNLVAGLGVALVLGAAAVELAHHNRALAASAAVLVSVAFVVGLAADVNDYRRSVAEGEEIVDTISAAFPAGPPRTPVLIVPEPAGGPGVAAFIPHIDIRGAMHIDRGGDWTNLHLVAAVRCASLADAGEWTVLDTRNGQTEPTSGSRLVGRCQEGA